MTSKSVKIGEGEWVVVCDGCKQKVPATSELGTDAPGRSHSSVGHGRSSVEQTDFHTQQEDEFLRGIMTKLDTAVQAGQITSIILVAPPRAIGVMRQGYTHGLKQAVREEIQKDYVNLPVYEIEKHLAA
jgi:protein required for attachment to host cells